jgi:hypothetical protein
MSDTNTFRLAIFALEFAILVNVLGGQNEAILAKMDEISSFLTELAIEILAERSDFVGALLPDDENEVSRLSTAYKTMKTAIKTTKGGEEILKKKTEFQRLFLKIIEEIVNENK